MKTYTLANGTEVEIYKTEEEFLEAIADIILHNTNSTLETRVDAAGVVTVCL